MPFFSFFFGGGVFGTTIVFSTVVITTVANSAIVRPKACIAHANSVGEFISCMCICGNIIFEKNDKFLSKLYQ